jgi:Kae1-associated kinase Bud32
MNIIAQGAESIVYSTSILNKEVIIKQRISKNYRNPILDQKIIKQRNKGEALLLKKVKDIAINTPFIYYIGKNKIIMQKLSNWHTHKNRLEDIGKQIAKLHNKNIIHGDLNLINIITTKDKVYFIDFGLGYISSKTEDKATDLLVFKKTLKSQKETDNYWENILEGYLKKTNSKGALSNLKEIEKRARYL